MLLELHIQCCPLNKDREFLGERKKPTKTKLPIVPNQTKAEYLTSELLRHSHSFLICPSHSGMLHILIILLHLHMGGEKVSLKHFVSIQ